jgi:uncharacterized protein
MNNRRTYFLPRAGIAMLLLLTLVIGVTATSVQATPVAFAVWDFEGATTDPSVDLTGNAVASAGSALGGESFPVGNPAGTSGASWSFNNWSLTDAIDADRYFEFKVDLTDYENVNLSFAERRSGTGPLTFEIHYSTDGVNFVQIPAATTNLPNNTDWRSHSFDLSGLNSEISGQASVQFRIYGYNATGTLGTWRIDDVTFTSDTDAPPAVVDFAVWDFEGATTDPSVDLTGNAVASAGSDLGGESFPAGNPAGTSGASWSFNNWAQTDALDTDRYFEFKVDLSTFENINLSFAERRSGTGPLTFEIHYSTDGTTFTQVPDSVTVLPNNTNWRSHSFDLSGLNSEIAGQSFVQFRIYGYDATGSTGTWRIDDVTFTGEPTAPPPPPPVVDFAVWDFEGATTDPSIDLTGNAVASAGSALGGESFPVGNPAGTSGASWSFNNWAQLDVIGPDHYFEFKVDLSTYENISLSFAERRSGTGPATFEIHYSTDGSTFIFIPGTVTSLEGTGWRTNSFDLSGLNSEIAFESSVQFRIYGYNASGITGTWRIDDVTFTGETSEAPPPPPPPPGGECGDPFTPIYDIQGSGNVSPLIGQAHATEGVIVGDFTGPTRLNGFFIQDPVGDDDPLTSDGIFIFLPAANPFSGTELNEGDLVRVFATVGEFFGLTQMDFVQNLLICDTGLIVEPTPVELPVPDPVDGVPYLERYEGMLVVFPQELTATDHFNLGRFGEVTLSVDGRLFNPTNVVFPGPDAIALQAENDRRQILLDDGSNLQNPIPPPPFFADDGTLRLGDTTQNLIGVMSFGFSSYRIQPTQPVEFTRINERTEFPDGVGGTIRVASFNVLNYFTTLDTGAPICGPEQNLGCRGANTPEEFERQRVKIIEAIVRLDADVIGLIELENNPSESLQDLVDGLNDELGPGTYDFIDTGTIGGDAIKLGIIYQPARVTPFGDYAILDSSVDARFLDDKNRPVLAQSFDASGEIFTVAINHLKSKGSPCDDVEDPDLGDGQANCNLTRTKAALAMADWLASDPTGSGDPDVFILGDLNAYRLEDPITALKEEGGYTDLVDLFIGEEAYSYVFFGQAGYLDHALATPSVVDRVTGVTIWAINADEPRALDYNDFNQPELFQPDQYRSSDHDPVLVGFCDAVAPTLNVSVTPEVLWPPNHQYVRVTATVSAFDNFDPSPWIQLVSVTSNEPDNGLGDGDMPNDIVIIDDFTFDLRAERSGLGNGRIYTITYQATDSCGNSSIEYATVYVPLSQGWTD